MNMKRSERIFQWKNAYFDLPEGVKLTPPHKRTFCNCHEFIISKENVYLMVDGVDNDYDDNAFFKDEEDASIFRLILGPTPITLGNITGKYIVYTDSKDSYAEYRFLLPNRHMMTILITARYRQDIEDILRWPVIQQFLHSFRFCE